MRGATMHATMHVRSATAQDAAGIVALHMAANPYEGWYRNPIERLGRARYEDLAPLERYLHGGFWMDLSLFRRHLHEYQRRGFPVFVAEEGSRIVGECEVWLDEEPPPFGRYAEVEMLESGRESRPNVERALLRHAADRVRKMGYEALDLSPHHSGGEAVAGAFGFTPVWDTRTFEADFHTIPKPEVEFTTRYLAGEYRALHGLLPLNHQEPARWRYDTLTASWPAAQVAGLPDAQKLEAMTVEAPDVRPFAVLAARREWLDPKVAEVDVWINPADLKKSKRLGQAFAIGAEIARRLGTKGVRTYAPPNAAKVLRSLGFTGGEAEDPWLRWTF